MANAKLEPVIFLDLDGVLVDFVGGACRRLGVTNPYDEPANRGVSDFVPLLGLSPIEFWTPLGRNFWSALHWTTDGKRILAAAETAVGPDRVCLLSTPCDTYGCADGKRDWVRREMPDYAGRLFLGKHKSALARPGAVLIDDSDANCDAWEKAGGTAILVPRMWNSEYGAASVAALRVMLKLGAFQRELEAA